MYESIVEKIYYFLQSVVTNPALLIVALYLIVFVALTLFKFWEGIFDEEISYIKNIIYFIYLPVLLVCCIMNFFSNTVINMAKVHTPDVVRSLIKIIFFPFLLLEVIGQNINKRNLLDRIIDAESKNVGNKLRIYQQCTKNLINIDASFLKDYYSENLFKFLAALLQVVSFFTTYAGVELFFGDLFSLSTLFITLVIQIGLFITSINANKPGKKNLRGKFLMSILLIISVTFSYIGLITQVSSPEESYEEVYKKYETVCNNKVDMNLDSLSKDKIEADIKNELENVISTLKLFDRKILQNIDKKKNLESRGEPEEYYTYKVGDVTTNSDGTRIQEGDLREPNAKYYDYNTDLEKYKRKIFALKKCRLELIDVICNVTGKKLKKLKKGKKIDLYYEKRDYDKISTIFENINYDKISTILQNASLNSLFDDNKKTDGILLTKKKCNTIIKQNNLLLEDSTINKNKINSYKISEELIDNKLEEYRKGSTFEKVTLEEWDDFRERMFSPINSDDVTFIDKILYAVGSWLGADLNNSRMHNLTDLLQAMQNKVRDNYNIVSLYLDRSTDAEILSELEDRKEEIEQIPNLFFIGFSRFAQAGKHRSNAIICIVLAVFNDFLTVILGLVGSRKAFSFLYVKSSKDYYNDIDELFGIVFKSMMQEFYISIRKGEFNNMDSSEFMEKCIQVIQKTSGAISSFLNSFMISECTSSMGYNLCFKYKTEDDIQNYRPIISVLLKTNMLKVVPYVYYRHFELEYYCGTKIPAWENDLSKEYISNYDNNGIKFEEYQDLLDTNKNEGNVLLLRNRAENYLRENMYVDINVVEDGLENHIPQVNETTENK